MNPARDAKLLQMSGEKAFRLTALSVILGCVCAQIGAEMVQPRHGWGFPLLGAIGLMFLLVSEITEFLSFERRLRPDGDYIADQVEQLYKKWIDYPDKNNGAVVLDMLKEIRAIVPADRL